MAYKPRVLTVPEGGTGKSSSTAYAVQCGGTTSTGALQSIAGVGTSGQILTSNGAGALPTFQDFSGGSGSKSGFSYFSEGLGVSPLGSGINVFLDDFYRKADSATASAQTGNISGVSTNPGLNTFDTGTNSAGWAAAFSAPTSLLFGGGTYDFECVIRLPTLSDVTNRYICYFGFGDHNFDGAEPVDGAYFLYSDNVNSGNWVGKTSSNSSRTSANSSTAVGTGYTKLKISVNAAGTSVSFYVNGSQIANSPLAATIPTSTGREFGVVLKITKTAGGTSRSFILDYISLNCTLTTPR